MMTVNERDAGRSYTLPEALRSAVRRWPDKTWLDFTGETYSFAEADRAVTRLAHGLADLGVERGDRVCFMLDNHADFVFLWMAVCKLGAVSVPINTAFKGEFLRHQIADAGAKLIVTEAEYADRMIDIEDGIPETHTVMIRGALPSRATRFDVRAMASAYSDDETPIDVGLVQSDLAMLLYTSGTTGPSKGCMISHGYICNSGWKPVLRTLVQHDDVYWTPCPLFHSGGAGVVIGTLQMGATASIHPRFSLSGFWPEIERSRATVAMILSGMLTLVPDSPDTEESRRCHGQLRVVMGVPFSTGLQQKWKDRFGVQHAGPVGYGMTEASPMTLRYLDQPAPENASGHVYEDFDVRIVDEFDRELPRGTPGEIAVRPLNPDVMFQGYWRRPEATVATTRNLWFHTGDIGRMDEQGYFYFVDRKKDYLRRGGENISSYELEVAFRQHPEIEDVAVHAVPSDQAEDDVKVTAIRVGGSMLSEEDLCRWSVERLPHFAVPRYIEFRDELPRNGVGRVLKYELRAQGVTPSSWDRMTSDIVVGRARRAATA